MKEAAPYSSTTLGLLWGVRDVTSYSTQREGENESLHWG